MTLRRLAVLVRNLPPDASLWAQVRASQEAALTSADRNRERMNFHRNKAKGAAE